MTTEQTLMEKAFPLMHGKPWLMVVIGVIELIAGIFLLSYSFWAGMASIWIGGFLFLFMAGIQLVHLFTSSKKSIFWNLLSVIMYLIVGVFMISNTLQAMAVWTLVIGIYILVAGIARTAMALQFRKSPGFGWALFSGIVSLILGGIVTFTWPQSSLWLLGTIVAIELIMTGWLLIVFGSSASRLKKEAGNG